MKKIVFGLLLLVAMSFNVAKADYLNITLASKHVNTDTQHNQHNWGLGYEWRGPWDRNWQIGTYRNSYWRESNYAMVELTTIRVSDTIRFRVSGGGVTGYRSSIMPVILPVWTYEVSKWGADVLTLPSLGGRQGIYAIQLKMRF